jgi:hypothetical protein
MTTFNLSVMVQSSLSLVHLEPYRFPLLVMIQVSMIPCLSSLDIGLHFAFFWLKAVNSWLGMVTHPYEDMFM